MPVSHQAEIFVDALFGTHKGYAAVASKNGTAGAWDEQTFHWPAERDLMLSWVDANMDGDVFICPALRKSKGRIKGDGAHLQWLWADVDMQDVPNAQRDTVMDRVGKLGTIVIKSGSANNVHVYVRLTRAVDLDTWRRLNLGLRHYLLADAKHTDNALLRVPGTINHKPGGRSVTFQSNGVTTKVKDPAKLLKHEPWRSVVVTPDVGVNDGAYDTVDVTSLLRGRVKAMVTMPTDEACGRYGTRHGAVYQVTAWLSKKGFTRDQVHSLMAGFPAGLDKQDTERGYSLHTDIARCLSANPTVETLEVVEDPTDVLEVVEGDEPDDTLLDAARKRLRQLDVEALARQMSSQRAFMPPPEQATYRWGERRDTPREPVTYAVDRIAAVGQNVTITGQFKAGKTLFSLNLVRSLVAGHDFLGEFKVRTLTGGASVGLWSLEMSTSDLDGYMDPLAIGDDLVVLSGRGYGVNVMTDVGRAWAVNWLRDNGVTEWVVDSHARMCRMAGVDENENGAVLGLLHRLDEIKEDAGVSELYYLAHTGRGEMVEGRERARGATVLDDWADARWILTRDGEVRFLAVEGRTVTDMAATSLVFDKETGGMTLGGRDKYGSKVDGLAQIINAIVVENPGAYNQRAMLKVVRERAGVGARNDAISDAISEAVECGFIEIRKQSGRGGVAHLYYPTGYGDGVVDDDGDGRGRGRASARVLDFSRVNGDGKRKKRGRDA